MNKSGWGIVLFVFQVSARVVLLDALQRMRLCAHQKSEEWVRHILVIVW